MKVYTLKTKSKYLQMNIIFNIIFRNINILQNIHLFGK